jgi:hypothetical protein
MLERKSLLRELDILTQSIGVDDDMADKDLQKCYKILEELLQKQDIKVSELTLVASFRYALGRKTYIVAEVVENILKNWDMLSSKAKNKIQEEIESAIKNDNAGCQIDIDQWNIILSKK